MKNKSIPVNAVMLLFSVLMFSGAQAQINTEELSLNISKAEDANLQKLKSYIWKRKSDAFVDGQLKLSTLTEFSFDATGKLQAKVVDAQTSVKKKPGIRGKMQENAAEDKMDYIGKALELSINYAYMTKGQLLDFFSKAVVSKKEDGTLVAAGENIYVPGDKLTVHVDPVTNLFKYKEFSSLLGKDPINGQINYDKFSSGVSHVSTTVLNMPAQKMKINATNQDYSQRVN
jgi:hypothetical protein